MPREDSFWPKTRWSALTILMLVVAVSANLLTAPVKADIVRVPGVKAGDWAKYSVSINYTTNDPNPPISPPPPGFQDIEYYKAEVQSVTGTTIKSQVTIRFRNGTEVVSSMSTDVLGPFMGGPSFFIAANLSAGDALYSGISPTINATLMRTYAGMEREVNSVIIESDIGPAPYRAHTLQEMYFDRATGILDELIWVMQFESPAHYLTHVAIHFVMTETNIWIQTVLSTEVNVTPELLNLRSEGKWITCLIKLPKGYRARDVDVSTLRLNDTIPAQTRPKARYLSYLMVKFDRQAVIELILSNLNPTRGRLFAKITLTVTGKLKDGAPFKGSCAVKILYITQTPREMRTHVIRA